MKRTLNDLTTASSPDLTPSPTHGAVGRGTLYGIFARSAFLVSSYVIHISLAYLVTPLEYGNFGVVLGVVTMARVFFSTGIPQTTSTLIARNESHSRAIWSVANRLQIMFAAAVTAVYLACIPLWSRALSDESLGRLLLIATPMVPLMAWHQINLAYLNGRLWFGLQSVASISYATLRVVLALALVVLGFGIAGAVGGLTLALLAVALFTRMQIPTGGTAASYRRRDLLSLSWPLMLFSFGTSALVNVDLLMLKHYHPDAAFVGYYSGASNLGRAPYFILTSFAVTLLPAVSMATGRSGKSGASRMVAQTISRLLLVAVPAIALLSVTSAPFLDLVYAEPFAQASTALSILAWSMGGLSVLVVLAASLTGVGRPRSGMYVVLGSTPIQLLAGTGLIPQWGMTGAAVANALAVATGLVIAGVLAFRRFGVFVEVYRVAKIGAASAAVAGMAWVLRPMEPWLLIPLYLAGLLVYVVIMLLCGGLTRGEIGKILDALQLRRRPA